MIEMMREISKPNAAYGLADIIEQQGQKGGSRVPLFIHLMAFTCFKIIGFRMD